MPAPGHTDIKWNSTINTIIYQCVKSVGCPLVVVFLAIHSPVLLAEIYNITELQQPDTSSRAMTGFYNVTPDGEQTAEDPLESGFAISAGSDFNPERPPGEKPESITSEEQSGKASRNKKETRETRTILVRVKRKRPERNRADQFQCERHGFYYTNDGRCIIPSYSYLPIIPQPLPKPGMRPMVQD